MKNRFKEFGKFYLIGGLGGVDLLEVQWLFFLLSFGCFFSELLKLPKETMPRQFLYKPFAYWFGFFTVSLCWLAAPLTVNLKEHGILIPLAVTAIPAYLAVPYMAVTYWGNHAKTYHSELLRRVYYQTGEVGRAFWFSFMTCLVMYFFGNYAPGFPWALPGYIWSSDVVMLQAFSIWGIYGQTFVTIFVGGLLGGAYFRFRQNQSYVRCALLALSILTVLFLFGWARLSENPTEYTQYRCCCVQASIEQNDKMKKENKGANFRKHLQLSSNKASGENFDFIIWPEASVPYLFYKDHYQLKAAMASIVPPHGYLISGVVREEAETKNIYNSVVVLDEFGKEVGFYDKKRLVPFGEYIPFRKFAPSPLKSLVDSIGDFDVGTLPNIIEVKGLKIAFAICYEAIFSGDIISREADCDVIVNVTNDGWFGHSPELNQHLRIVRARAVEEGRPLIRATNFGISAVFDAYGRQIASLGVDEVGTMDFFIPKKVDDTIFRCMRHVERKRKIKYNH